MGKRIKEVKRLVTEWANKQGHNKCWYFPTLFNELCRVLEITITPIKISRSEFEVGCSQYQDELFGKKENLRDILPFATELPPLPELLLYEDKGKSFWAIRQSCSHIRDLTNGCLRERYNLKQLGVRRSDGTISPT
jgi:hypothetical protein